MLPTMAAPLPVATTEPRSPWSPQIKWMAKERREDDDTLRKIYGTCLYATVLYEYLYSHIYGT